MKKLNRAGLAILMCMVFFLPFWLTFGRGLLGSGGWMTIMYIFTYAPMLLVGLLAVWFLLRFRADVRETKSIGSLDSIVLLALYVSIFLHGIFLLDGGDTPDSVNSVAMHVFGMDKSTSDALDTMFASLCILLFVVTLVLCIVEFRKKRAITLALRTTAV